MIGISVAVGRFVEALIWAIARVAGVVAGYALVAAVGIALAWFVVRRIRRMRRPG